MEKPGSTTYTMPSIVREVSAMFVLTMTFRPEEERGIHEEEDRVIHGKGEKEENSYQY